ncbi:hypothetical protein LL965_02470 [Xanthomonas cassavae CFBP 4642]|uniref:Uncharacterized protein n=1 Tax=Xanthomonas cassavae CFBP 4642 TaxID=1219375 RepID=A0ABS8HAB1_9XANT|nr:hypothetical protein [Xanthomonas cassavae]MCC4618992.1 hypothetical protein [Xanthomonas cassavae CFBP 4642]
MADTASQQGVVATLAQADVEQDDRPPPKRKSTTGDPDVDDLLYALDSKNDLAIEQALKRVGNSAHSAALAQQGHEHPDAKAQQEAQLCPVPGVSHCLFRLSCGKNTVVRQTFRDR